MATKETPLVFEGLPGTQGSFKFVQDSPIYLTEVPYEAVGTLSPEQESMRSNVKWEAHEVPVHDIRQHMDHLSIERTGFEFIRRQDLSTFDLSTEKGLKTYLLGAIDLLKERFNSEEVIIYNYNFRKSGTGSCKEETSGINELPGDVVNQMHTDGTPEGGWRRVRQHLKAEEIERYLDGSWHLQIVTIWRPINTVFDAPLAVCDPVSLAKNDLLPVSRVTPEYIGEIFYLKYNPQQRYYYVSDQQPEELLLFTAWDSEDGEKIVPHGSFLNRQVDASLGETSRESIDLRAIVITKKE